MTFASCYVMSECLDSRTLAANSERVSRNDSADSPLATGRLLDLRETSDGLTASLALHIFFFQHITLCRRVPREGRAGSRFRTPLQGATLPRRGISPIRALEPLIRRYRATKAVKSSPVCIGKCECRCLYHSHFFAGINKAVTEWTEQIAHEILRVSKLTRSPNAFSFSFLSESRASRESLGHSAEGRPCWRVECVKVRRASIALDLVALLVGRVASCGNGATFKTRALC